MPKKLSDFKYMSFDVVGTLIDFEGGLKATLAEIGTEHGVEVDGEKALALYRTARYSDATDLFPDDLVRVYLIIAPELGLPAERALGERLRDAAKSWKGFADSRAAMAELADSPLDRHDQCPTLGLRIFCEGARQSLSCRLHRR